MIAAIIGFTVGWFSAEEGVKTQDIRLLDVAVLGPFLIFAAPGRVALRFIGGATVGFNLRNFLVQQERTQTKQ